MERYQRTYTIVRGNNHPATWKIIPSAAVANAVVKISEYFKGLKNSLTEEQKTMLGVRRVKLPFSTIYQFGENCVTEQSVMYEEDPSLVIDTGSKEGLETLVKIAELDKFEHKKRISRKTSSKK